MDRQFFIDEVRAAERSLYRIARSYLPSDADAADAVQEALTRAWSKRDTLRETRFFRTWLTRIAINVCKDELKRRKRAQSALPQEPPPALEADSEQSALRDALGALDVKYRLPIVLYYLDGYSLKEIGVLLSLPQGTVKNRLFRAREKLRDLLEGKGAFCDEA